MHHRKLTTSLAILAATAGVSVFAATANAVVVDYDNVTLNGDEVDLTDGNLAWDYSNGRVTPKLTGRLEATNADDTNVRVRIDSYNGSEYLDTEEGGAMFVDDDTWHHWSVDRPGISNVTTDRAVVAVEKETVNGWETQAETTVGMSTHRDYFTVLRDGVDIAGTGWAGGAPTSDASVSWPIDDGLVTPEFTMRLHMEDLGGVCGRIKVRYLTEDDAFLDSGKSTQRCPGDNNHYGYLADIPPYTSGEIGKVEVIAQTRAGGQWNDSGSTTLSIEE